MKILLAELTAALLPFALSGIGAFLTIAITRAANSARARWGIEIEARHREALHSAIMSGILAALGRGAKRDDAIQAGISHALESVPDAISALAPKDGVLRSLAESKLRELTGVARAK